MVLYNLTNLTSATQVSDVALFANSASNGILFGFGLIGVYIILLIALMRFDFDSNLLASSFVMFVLSSVLAFGEFVSMMFPLGFLLILALTGLFVYMTRQ